MDSDRPISDRPISDRPWWFSFHLETGLVAFGLVLAVVVPWFLAIPGGAQ